MTNPRTFRHQAAPATGGVDAHGERSSGLSIRAKILLGLVLMSLLPILIFGYLDIKSSYHAREVDFAKMELEHARSILQSIEVHFDSEMLHIDNAAQQRIAPALIQGHLAKLSQEVKILATNTDYECVSLIDLSGKVTHSSCPSLANGNVAGETWFREALRGARAYGRLQRDPASGNNVIPLAVPVFRDANHQEQMGVLAVHYRWSEVHSILSRFQVQGSPQSVANHFMLTEKSGLVIWCYDPSEILTHHLVEAGMTSALAAREGREGYAYEVTEHGIPSFSVYTHSKAEAGIVRPEWLLVVLHDPVAVFAEVKARSQNFFLLLATMGVVLVLLALRMSTSIALPIREVTQAIRRFKDDATGAKVSVAASGEARVLADAFNEMTDRLVKSKGELRANWVLHQSILQTAMAGFWLVDSEGQLQEVNRSYCLMSGYSEQELLGRNVAGLETAETAMDAVEQLKKIRSSDLDRFETRHRRKDGTTFEVEVSTQHLRERDGWFVVFIQDITERKQSEQLLQQSLKDKHALLMEVNHRVKNNLQVIISLLRLEGGRSEVADTKAVLATMQGRIRAMALLHESLYRTGSFASVDLGANLGQLANQAFRAQVIYPDKVQLKLHMGSVLVGMDQAICGCLLVNELISNCLKHGFPDGRCGEVSVELQPADPENPQTTALWCLRVSDTGVGLPSNFEVKDQTSLGLQLVDDLSRQIGGTLTIQSQPGAGAQFSVVFKTLPPAPLATPL